MTGLDSPAAVMARLQQIENDLAARQVDYEAAALEWFVAKRERERQAAATFISVEGTVAERQAAAVNATALIGVTAEASFEAQKAVVRTLDTRAAIGMSILRAQTRGGGG